MSATNTGSSLGATGTTGTTPTTSTAGTTGNTTTGTTTGGGHGQAGQVASGIKGVFAKVHGAGEEIRGQLNGAVDEAFHEVRYPLHSSLIVEFNKIIEHRCGKEQFRSYGW